MHSAPRMKHRRSTPLGLGVTALGLGLALSSCTQAPLEEEQTFDMLSCVSETTADPSTAAAPLAASGCAEVAEHARAVALLDAASEVEMADDAVGAVP